MDGRLSGIGVLVWLVVSGQRRSTLLYSSAASDVDKRQILASVSTAASWSSGGAGMFSLTSPRVHSMTTMSAFGGGGGGGEIHGRCRCGKGNLMFLLYYTRGHVVVFIMATQQRTLPVSSSRHKICAWLIQARKI